MYKEFNKDDCSAVPPGGESFYQMKKRVLNYIKNKLPTWLKSPIRIKLKHEQISQTSQRINYL